MTIPKVMTKHPAMQLFRPLATELLGPLLCLLAACGTANAQAPQPPVAPVTAKGANPDGEVVTLNPFQVTTDSDKSYGALNSNSITQFNTRLEELPLTADIFTDAFMKDVGETTSVEALIQNYSAGAGYASTTPGKDGSTNPQTNSQDAGNKLSLRGLSSTTIKRDTFMSIASSNGSTGNFDIERVEVINGPQSLLYGDGGSGGVVNLVSKQARFGQAAFGSLTYKVDQYGAKLGELDYGVGTSDVAVRLALLDERVSGFSQFLGGPERAAYLQIGARVFGNTVIRLTGEKLIYDRVENMQSQTVTAVSTANDARNGDFLHYLLATNQMQASANGAASGMGYIGNGTINWSNVDALDGQWGVEDFNHSWTIATAQTKWSDYLSTEADAGYDNLKDPRMNASNFSSILAPSVTTNPTGTWALASTGKAPAQNQNYATRAKSFRLTALLTNTLGNLAKSETLLGADFTRTLNAKISYSYFAADSNFNTIVNPASTVNGGKTVIPSVYIPIGNGPVKYPLWGPFAPEINYGGTNYVLQINNTINPALISPSNPLGVSTLGGQNYSLQTTIDKGLFFINDTSWLDNKFDSLVGARLTKDFSTLFTEVAPPQNYYLTKGTLLSYDAGVNYNFNSWLHPYVSFSDSFNPPSAGNGDPYGNYGGTSRGIGEEAGVKMSNKAATVSGSVAFFHVSSTNEPYAITNTLSFAINPSGLNGRYGAAPSTWVSVNRDSDGINLAATLAPTSQWRMRFSAAYTKGEVSNNVSYAQLYNDQFYENSQGQVTYADGTVVYVPATYNSKQLTVASTATGAVPLTVALMSNPSSSYYANPLAISGAILSSSPAAAVLKVVDPVHGSILTGATGLPISAIQINPGFTPAGTLDALQKGDPTLGYPTYALNMTNLYTFAGPLKGLQAGATVILSWKNSDFTYYPNGPQPGARDATFYLPNQFRVDPILAYTVKLRRMTFKTQLNITNVFNRYHVVITPNPVLGYSGADDATFDTLPRYYSLTNTLSF